MKKIYYGIVIVILLLPITFICNAQTVQKQKNTFVFKISPANITTSQPSSLNEQIDYTNHTTDPASDEILLFSFYKSYLTGPEMSVFYRPASGLLSLRARPNHTSDDSAAVYNLFYTKVDLSNGDNILTLEVEDSLLWFTCKPGSATYVPTGNDTGEGVLWVNDMSLLTSANLNIYSFIPCTLLTDSSTTISRGLSEEYYEDPVYDEYGYGDEDLTQPWQLGNGLNFDGTNDNVSVPSSSSFSFGTGDFTLEAWVKYTTNPSGNRVIIGRYNGSGDNYWLGVNSSNKAIFSISGSGITGTKTINDGVWHHIAGVRTAGVVTLYVDGIQDATGSNTNGASPGGALKIGAFNTGFYFPGTIDEARIWNIARTQADIQDNMFLELDGNETGLVAYYDFNQGAVCSTNTGITTLPDITGHSNTGTLTNMALTGTGSNWVVGVIPPSYDSVCINSTLQLDNDADGGTWSSVSSNIATVDNTGMVTGISAGTTAINYTITNASGCNSVYTTYITVNALPSAAGIYSNGNSFDGNSDYVDINNSLGNFGTGDFTVEVKFKATGTKKYLVSKRATCNHGNFWNVFINVNGKLAAELDESSAGTNYVSITGTSTVNDGQWHHVAIARRDSVLRLFIDGSLEGAVAAPTNLNNTNSLRLGWICSAAQYFPGTMDEVRIWNVGRTLPQIQSFMNRELRGTEPGLIAYYDFNHGIAGGTNAGKTVLVDKTVSGNHGTLNSFALTGSSSNWVAGNVANTGIEVCPGGTAQLSSSVAGGIWYSSDVSIATVSSTGVVTGVSGGTATITYTITNASGCGADTSTTVNVIAQTVNTGNSLSFDGTNDYVSISNSTTASFTLEAYIKTSAASLTGTHAYEGNGILYSDIAGGGNDFTLAVLNNNIAFFDGNKNSTVISNATVTDGLWHHIALVRTSGGNMTIYIDGFEDASAPAGTGALTANSNIMIGGNTIDGRYFNGQIDEVRIWNIARSQDDIQSTMNTELIGSEANLVDYYNFNQGIQGGVNYSINTLTDKTAAGNTGTLTNFTLTAATSNWVIGSSVPASSALLCANGTIQLNNATPGGVWTSSNGSIALVSNTGLVTATGSGTVSINYESTSAAGCEYTSTTQVNVNQFNPTGVVDGISPESPNTINGWAYDPDTSGQSIAVHIYTSTGTFVTQVIASDSRPDVNAAFNITGNHGFHFDIPSQFLDGNTYTFNFYGINLPFPPYDCGNPVIGTQSFTYCTTPVKPVATASPATICSGSSTTLSTAQVAGYTYKWATTPNGTSIGTQSSITVSPSANTTYYVTVTNSCGASNTSDGVTVTIGANTTSMMTSTTSIKQVTVGSNGKAYAILSDDRVYVWTGSNWSRVNDNIYASSIAIDNTGRLWWVATSSSVGEVFYISCNSSGITTGASTEFVGSSALKVACGSNGTVAIIGTDHHIWKWNGNVGSGSNSASFTQHPYTYAGDVAVDASGRIWYTDGMYHGIVYLNSSNQWITLGGYAGNQVACGKDGSVYVTGWSDNAVYKWNGSTGFNVVSSMGYANNDLAIYSTGAVITLNNSQAYRSACFSGTGAKSSPGGNKPAAEVLVSNQFNVYPNPNAGTFTVSFNLANASPVSIRLVDVQGRTVYQENSNADAGNHSYMLQPAITTTGIYFLQIATNEFSKTEKLIIEK